MSAANQYEPRKYQHNYKEQTYLILAQDYFVRKLTSILLIICLCCTWLGYHLVFRVQLLSIKSEMKAFLRSQENHKDVIELSFTHEESKKLEWEDEAEFSYKGEMYDVIEKQTKGNRILLRCIADTKETALLQEYQKNNNRNSSNTFIAQLITAQFILPANDSIKKPERIIKRYFSECTYSLLTTDSIVLSPPPDVC